MRRTELLLITLLLLALTPYFVICFYALPFADDFCYGWTSAEHIPFIQRFLRQYSGCSGRYSAHVLLCNHPLVSGSLLFYRVAIFAALTMVLAGLFLFIQRIIRNLLITVVVTLTALLFYLCYMPQLTEGVYWYTGICDYEFGSIFILLHFAFLLTWFKSKGAAKAICFFITAALLIISIGFNEIGAALIPAYYLFAVIVLYRHKATSTTSCINLKPILVLFGIAILSSAFVVFAPGNFVRGQEFPAKFNFFHSVLFAALQTARFTATWLGSVPALGLSFMVLAKADRVPDTSLLRFNFWLILPLLLFTVFMGAFLPYYGTGILGQHRTINYVFFLFILLWLWLLVSLSKKYMLHQKLELYIGDGKRLIVALVSLGVMMGTANSGNILHDFYKHNFETYRHEFMQRQEMMIHHPEAELYPLQNIPKTFEIVDARRDNTWWVNKCMKYFYRDTRIELK